MKKTALLVFSVGVVLSLAACSQYSGGPYPRTGYGPGMMDGYDSSVGYGPGMMGGGYGPGMMGGGYGPGMMGGGYGPGMMGGGYGPGMMGGGYGPGMMGGGYGRGMMGGGYGPGMVWDGHGPGMMGGYGLGPGMMWDGPSGAWTSIPDLTDEQRSKITQIQKENRQKQWALMQAMHELQFQQGSSRDGMFDEQAARKAFEARETLRKQMFENGIQMRKGIDAVLTPKQREQLRAGRAG